MSQRSGILSAIHKIDRSMSWLNGLRRESGKSKWEQEFGDEKVCRQSAYHHGIYPHPGGGIFVDRMVSHWRDPGFQLV